MRLLAFFIYFLLLENLVKLHTGDLHHRALSVSGNSTNVLRFWGMVCSSQDELFTALNGQ